MGRKRNKKRSRHPHQQQHHHSHKKNDNADLVVWVTRCILTDDHFSANAKKKPSPSSNNNENTNVHDDDDMKTQAATLAQQGTSSESQKGPSPLPSSATAEETVDATPSSRRANDVVCVADAEAKNWDDANDNDVDNGAASARKRLKKCAAAADDGERMKRHGGTAPAPNDEVAVAPTVTTTETATATTAAGQRTSADTNAQDESTVKIDVAVAVGDAGEKQNATTDASLLQDTAVPTESSTQQQQPQQPVPTQTIATEEKPATIKVWMSQSARRRLPRLSHHRNVVELPHGDNGDGIVNPYPTTEVADKYWSQRKRYFAKFDEGCVLDKEGWFSVTPELIANHTAQRMVAPFRPPHTATTAAAAAAAADTVEKETAAGIVILDAFAGVGGNVIAFARRPEVRLVICVDTDRNRLMLAAQNCAVYEISPDKVLFVHADACHVLDRYNGGVLLAPEKQQEADVKTAVGGSDEGGTATAETTAITMCTTTASDNDSNIHGYRFGRLDVLPSRLDAIFLSPPWGGIDYRKVGPYHYDIGSIDLGGGRNGHDLLQMASQALPQERKVIAYFLPRNTDAKVLGQAALHAGFRGHIEMEQNVVNGKIKTVTCYTGLPRPTGRA